MELMFNGKSDRRVRAGMIALAVLVGVTTVTLRAEKAAERLGESATVLKEIMEAPDKGIPEDLLQSAYCVVIVPGVKQAALGIGGNTAAALRCAARAPAPTGGRPPRCGSKAAASAFRSACPRPTSSCW